MVYFRLIYCANGELKAPVHLQEMFESRDLAERRYIYELYSLVYAYNARISGGCAEACQQCANSDCINVRLKIKKKASCISQQVDTSIYCIYYR